MPRMGDLAQIPDVGPPLVGDLGQFSPGLPAVNAMAENWNRPQPVPEGATLYNTKAGPITEGDIGRASNIAMGFSGGGLGIKAYHSSPHDFERFDLSKIGTGEGAQMYGHGLYFAENPAVSGQGGQYWNQFLGRFKGTPEVDAASRLRDAGFDRGAAHDAIQPLIDRIKGSLTTGEYPNPAKYGASRDYYEGLLRDLEAQQKLLASGKPVGPRTYEVDIGADPSHFLDWDKPLNKQSPEVVEGLQRAMRPSQWQEFNPAQAGTAMKQGFIGLDERIASEKLRDAGIPGIRYLDQGSRAGIPNFNAMQTLIRLQDEIAAATNPAHKAALQAELAKHEKTLLPTSNYVVFDPNSPISKVDIVRKYGLAGATTMGALAAQNMYGDQAEAAPMGEILKP